MAKKLSPMMAYYLNLKEEYRDEIVFFRLGDFYEMFYDDALKASAILGITLTGRDCGLDEKAPMCGVPYHAAEGYIAKLIAAGEKVAICEQLTEPNGRGIVERGVVRVVTSGTATDENSLDQRRSNYLASITAAGDEIAIAYADITTGELCAIALKKEINIIESVLGGIMPSEIITDSESYALITSFPSIEQQRLPKPRNYNDAAYRYSAAYNNLTKQLKVSTMQVYECEGNKPVISALGGLLSYINETQKREMTQINDLKILKDSAYMLLDANTRRNLELTASARDSKVTGSLLWVLDATKTSMGARLIKNWIERPLKSETEIDMRLDAVEELIGNNFLRANLTDKLGLVRDIERLSCKIPNNNCSPRDLYALSDALKKLPDIKGLTAKAESDLLKDAYENIDVNAELCELLINAICDNPPAVARDGGFIKKGFHEELDYLRNAKENGGRIIAEIEAKERESTGIKTLKISYNRVHGYYIEVPKSVSDKVPFNYVRRQTTANSERYITEELKSVEDTVLSAQDKSVKLELEIFSKLKEAVLSKLVSLQRTARAIALIDVLRSFADVARANGYTRPIVKKGSEALNIVNGRHPIVEKHIGRNYYTPNDTYLDGDENRTMVITGPNMAGKSTYMRQVAVIALMSQIGCFVPADIAEVPIMDRIFTRIGASDDLMSGQSTFMVEMVEVATILKNCTDSSLIILDEIGRGTSTCDGLSIAWSVIEYISANYKCKTMFSTHYHELTELENELSGIRNYKINVSELGGQVVFTHKISKGGADKSFGIEVAELAGIPAEVIERARSLNAILEENNVKLDVNGILLGKKAKPVKVKQQTFLMDAVESEIVCRLKSLKTENMTPMQALVELDNLKSSVK